MTDENTQPTQNLHPFRQALLEINQQEKLKTIRSKTSSLCDADSTEDEDYSPCTKSPSKQHRLAQLDCYDPHDQEEAYLSVVPTMDEIKPSLSCTSLQDIEHMVSYYLSQLSIVDEIPEDAIKQQ
jgi:hypothetical protein